MRRQLKHIFNIGLILLMSATYGLAQEDSTRVTIKTGPSIYLDYGKILTLPSPFERKLEAGVAWRFGNKISPNFQFGMAKLEPSGAINNGTYLSEGTYMRFGVDYFIPYDATSTFFAGAKYGMSSYDENGEYEIASELWDNYTDGFIRSDLKADWFEIILGSETIISQHVQLGGYFSLRILNKRDEFTPVDTYSIPGYGRAFDKSTPAMNLYVRLSL